MPAELQYLTINDFAPGIRHKVFGGGQAAAGPLGAADPAATFRCVVLAGGGLGPLPALVQTKTRDEPGDSFDDKFRISGFHVTGPMQEQTYQSTFDGVDNVEVHLAYEFMDADHKWVWERINLWHSTEFDDTIESRTIVHPNPSAYDDNYRPTAFVDARMHATDPLALGDVFVVAGYHPDDMDATNNVWLIFPDPAAPNSTSTAVILDVNETTLMVQHQGRVISIDNHVFDHGGSGHWVVNDQLVFTQVNLPTVAEDPPGTIIGVNVFTQGPVSGYGAVVSSTAQELLLVKHRGGATLVSGDIDDPTVMSMPGVASTRGAVTYGVFTPVGFVYGVKDGGIHAWGGGDSSEKLSIYLDDDFWQMRPSDWKDFDGKFDTIGDFILCPNNWIYDIPSKSWWRLEDPATYQIFQWAGSPQSSNFYGAPAEFQDGEAIFYRFDLTELVSDYQWQSQYIAQSIDRVMDIRELNLRALSPNGESTVTVTLTNEAGQSQVEQFDVTATEIPKLIRVNTAFKGTGIKVKMEASSLDGAAAPTIYELNLGFQLEQQEAMNAG